MEQNNYLEFEKSKAAVYTIMEAVSYTHLTLPTKA